MSSINLEKLKVDRALLEKRFDCLLPYPKLLYIWQRNRPDDVLAIARISCHRNSYRNDSMRHKLCYPRCEIIDRKMRKILVKLMTESLQKRIQTYQATLF